MQPSSISALYLASELFQQALPPTPQVFLSLTQLTAVLNTIIHREKNKHMHTQVLLHKVVP